MRTNAEVERDKIVQEVRRQVEAEKERAILETKKKKWVRNGAKLLVVFTRVIMKLIFYFISTNYCSITVQLLFQRGSVQLLLECQLL